MPIQQVLTPANLGNGFTEDAPNGKFHVSGTVYGSEFHLFESPDVSTDLTGIWQTKIDGTTNPLLIGLYRVMVSYGWNADSTTTDFESRLLFSGVMLGGGGDFLHKQEAKDRVGQFEGTTTNQRHGFQRTLYVNIQAQGAHSVQLQWRTQPNSNRRASLWGATVEIMRVN